MANRKKISMGAKLAASYIALGLVDREQARKMTTKEILALVETDHRVLHAFTGDDHPANLDPMLKPAHREKSRRDTSIAAKAKRIDEAQAEHQDAMRRKMLARTEREEPEPKKRSGPKLRGAKMPCGRGSEFKKTMSGRVIRRQQVPEHSGVETVVGNQTRLKYQ